METKDTPYERTYCTYKCESHENLKLHVEVGPPSLHYYCAVVLHSCIVLPPVGHSSHYEYHCCQLADNRAVFRNFNPLLMFSFHSPSYIPRSTEMPLASVGFRRTEITVMGL